MAASYLQTRIDLFLVEIYLARGDQHAAEETLNRAAAALRSLGELSKPKIPPVFGK